MNQEERIIAILKIRGFLIDEIDGHYYMSGNASVEDVEYLKIGFDKYSLGQIKNSNVYKKSSRRCWDKSCLSRSYVYNSIIPQTTEVIISDRVSEGDAIMFFHSLNRNRSEAGPTRRSWQEFSWERLGSKVCVSQLESYVVLGIIAISEVL